MSEYQSRDALVRKLLEQEDRVGKTLRGASPPPG